MNNPLCSRYSQEEKRFDFFHPVQTTSIFFDRLFKVDSGWRYLMAGRLVAVGEDKEEEAFYTDSTYSWGQ